MSNLIFKSFNLGNNLIDDLFLLFELNSFKKYKKIKSCLHKYNWPQIVLSNEKKLDDIIVFHDEIVDLKKREKINPKEDENEIIKKIKGYSLDLIGQFSNGDVYLFNLNIEKCAISFYKYFNNYRWTDEFDIRGKGNLNDIINSLMEIVLVHETVHFLMDNQNKIKYLEQDEVYYHEAIAQFFTAYLIKEHKLHNSIFEWLLENQLERYRIFKKFHSYDFYDVVSEIKNSCKSNNQSFDYLISNLQKKRVLR
jgi:hypothetical protein